MSWFGSSSARPRLFYVVLIAVASLVVGMVIASRLDLTPASSAQTLAVPPMNSAPLSGPLDAKTFRNIAKAQSPMVVNIRTETRQRTQDLSRLLRRRRGGRRSARAVLRQPGGRRPGPARQGQRQQQRQPREQTTQAAGTGFIINKDGFILTNNHVVEDATKIEVQLFDEDDIYYQAKSIGRDPLTDSALIQLIEKPNHPLAGSQVRRLVADGTPATG